MFMYVYAFAAIAVVIHDITGHPFSWGVWLIMSSIIFMVSVVGVISINFLTKDNQLLKISTEDSLNLFKMTFYPSKTDIFLPPIACSFFAWYGYIHGELWLTVGYIGAIFVTWFARIKLKNEFIRLEEEFKK